MPKIIENIQGRAIEEARKELIRSGYAALTVRGIAKKLGIGLGTFYNYFPSKDHLAACVMLEDWQLLLRDFESGLTDTGDPERVFYGLFDLVRTFSKRYDPTWKEYEMHGSSRAMLHQYHGKLVNQLAGYLLRAIPADQKEKEPYLAGFLAELILRFGSDSDILPETVGPAVTKLLRKEQSAAQTA